MISKSLIIVKPEQFISNQAYVSLMDCNVSSKFFISISLPRLIRSTILVTRIFMEKKLCGTSNQVFPNLRIYGYTCVGLAFEYESTISNDFILSFYKLLSAR
jgi:hypothetical protein